MYRDFIQNYITLQLKNNFKRNRNTETIKVGVARENIMTQWVNSIRGEVGGARGVGVAC